MKVFTSDSFGIGLRLFLERFVGRYLQFSQMMSVKLRRCRLMPPCLPIALS
ncbi:phage recombination protein Bet, partial [Escherichia coli EC1850]